MPPVTEGDVPVVEAQVAGQNFPEKVWGYSLPGPNALTCHVIHAIAPWPRAPANLLKFYYSSMVSAWALRSGRSVMLFAAWRALVIHFCT